MDSFEISGDDVQAIRDVLSVHHVPVVASLHWDKLHSILHSLCDRIGLQALRLDKAEEQGKAFMGYKEEMDELCRNCVKEMKEEKESEVEQQKNWASMVEEKLQMLQQGLNNNSDGMKHLGDTVAGLQSLDSKVQSLEPRLDALEEATKKLDALDKVTKSTDSILASQSLSLETFNQKVEVLLADFDEQHEKLHSLEEQTDQLKLKLEQTTCSHAADLEALQQYCKNLRSDFELKFLVEAAKPHDEEISSASKAKLETAVAELQNRIQKKADVDDMEKMLQINQNLKDTCAKMESSVVELQSQLKRLNAGSRRASRASFVGGILPLESQMSEILNNPGEKKMHLSLPETKPISMEELSPKVEELTKDIKEAIVNHDKELEKVQKEFGVLGRSILKMSGHEEDELMSETFDRTDKLVKTLEGLVRQMPLDASPTDQARKDILLQKPHGYLDTKESQEGENFSSTQVLEGADIRKDETVDQLAGNAVVQAIDDALKANKFEPKESIKTFSRLCEELLKLTTKLQELDTAMPALKSGLSGKADKRDLQKLVCFVKEQLERPENAIFTGKPLFGFKCMACDHSIEKLSRVTGEHLPTNRMPPQVLPMLSAERIFSLDRRPSNNAYGQSMQSPTQGNKTWIGNPNLGVGIAENGNVDKRQQRFRKGSTKKAVT